MELRTVPHDTYPDTEPVEVPDRFDKLPPSLKDYGEAGDERGIKIPYNVNELNWLRYKSLWDSLSRQATGNRKGLPLQDK